MQQTTLIDANYIAHSTFHVSKFRCKKIEEYVKDQLRRINTIRSYHKNCTFVYDSKNGSRTNKAILEGYKSSRSASSEEQKQIFSATKALVRALGYSYASHPKYEADQLIGSYALHLYQKGVDVKIVATDKDFNQLIKKSGIVIYDPLKNCERNYDDIVERYKIRPSQFAMYLTLLGDSIDDVPGLARCGPVAAVKFIKQYKKYAVARRKILLIKKPTALELAFQQNVDLLDKCFRVVKLTKIEGIDTPPAPAPYSLEKVKKVCAKYDLNYKYLF